MKKEAQEKLREANKCDDLDLKFTLGCVLTFQATRCRVCEAWLISHFTFYILCLTFYSQTTRCRACEAW